MHNTKKRRRIHSPAVPLARSLARQPDTIADLIEILEDRTLANPPLMAMSAIVPTLRELDALVGLAAVKRDILELIICLSQETDAADEMLNVCIYGPPGSGKTTLCILISRIFIDLKILRPSPTPSVIAFPPLTLGLPCIGTRDATKEYYLVGSRSTLIGGYLGQTTIKTQKLIDRCVAEGKVFFIDEVYQLGSNDKIDSFAKEVVDCINSNLSTHGRRLICIIAGYENEVDICFFSHNPGLTRRFPFKFHIDKYTSAELLEMLKRVITKRKFTYDFPGIDAWFAAIDVNRYFANGGGDIDNLFMKIKIRYYRRMFGQLTIDLARCLSRADIETGYTEFIKTNRESKEDNMMYC